MNAIDTLLVVILVLGTIVLNKEHIRQEFFSKRSKTDKAE